MKFFETREDFIILTARFAEAQTGIEDDLRPVDPGGERAADRCLQAVGERAPDVPGEGHALHRLGPAAQMHQDQRARWRHATSARRGSKRRPLTSFRILAPARGLVPQPRLWWCRWRSGRRVTFAADRHDRQHAPKFFLRRNALRARPRGLTAHVDPVRPLAGQFHAMLDGANRVQVMAAVGERIRGHVEHAHDEGASAQTNLPVAFDLEFRARSCFHGRVGARPNRWKTDATRGLFKLVIIRLIRRRRLF